MLYLFRFVGDNEVALSLSGGSAHADCAGCFSDGQSGFLSQWLLPVSVIPWEGEIIDLSIESTTAPVSASSYV